MTARKVAGRACGRTLGGLLAAAAIGAPAATDEAPQPRFEFAAKSLAIAWTDTAHTPVGVTVVNNTTEPLELALHLSPLELKNRKKQPVDNARVLRVTVDGAPADGKLKLPGAGAVTVRIEAIEHPLDVAPGSYPQSSTAYVTLSEADAARAGGADTVARLPVTVSVSKPGTAPLKPLKPLVDSLAMTVYRDPLCGSETCPDCRVPIHVGGDGGAVKDTLVGGLANDKGGTVPVYARDLVAEPAPSLGLEAPAAPRAGTYKGKIHLQPGDATGDVSVTLTVKHVLHYPVLVLGASVYAALRIRRYLTVQRGVWTLRTREAALGASFRHSQAAFERAATGHPYTGLSVSDDFAARRSALTSKLDELARSGDAVNPEAAGYKKVDEDLASIETALRLWEQALPAALAALEAALAAARDAQTEVPDQLRGPSTQRDPPGLVERDEILARRHLKLAELAGLREKALRGREFLATWTEAAHLATELQGTYEALEARVAEMDEARREALKTSKKSLDDGFTNLWHALSFDDKGPLDSLARARADFDSLWKSLRRGDAGQADNASGRERRALQPSTRRGAPAELLPDDRRREYYSAALWRWDFTIGWLAFVIAVITGLNQHYFGQPFGTARDYMSLILVGLGTRAALDAVAAVLDRFVLPR